MIYFGRMIRHEPFSPRAKAVAYGLAILALTGAAYAPVLKAGFVWDDSFFVMQGPAKTQGSYLRDIWIKPGATAQCYPMSYTAFWIESHLWSSPAGYHAVNVFFHAANAVLLALLLEEWGLSMAWLIGLCFALHPIQVESVAWVSELKNVLSTFFYLLALAAYVRHEAFDDPPAWRWNVRYAAAFLFYFCAVSSKTVACSLPAILLLIRWWKKGRMDNYVAVKLLPFFAVGLGFGLLTIRMEMHAVGASGAAWEMPWSQHLLVAGRALWFYAGKLLYPYPLIFMYPRWTPMSGLYWFYPITAALLLGFLWVMRERWGRGAFAAVAFFVLTLVPALGFFNLYPMRYSFVADHFQYVAGIGLIALFVTIAADACLSVFGRESPWIKLLLGCLVLSLFISTRRELSKFDNLEALWADTLIKNPTCAMAHNNLAGLYFERRDYERAVLHVRLACALDPQNSEAATNLRRLER